MRTLIVLGITSALIILTIFTSFINAGKVEIQVNYEALCPDSVRFINIQLSNALKVYKNQIVLKLIPFGKANVIYIYLRKFNLSVV